MADERPYKETLLRKIEQAMDEFDKYQVNSLITIGGIDFESGKLKSSNLELDHPSDVPLDEFFRNIFGLYSCVNKINTLCELCLEIAEEDGEKQVVREMMKTANEKKVLYEGMILGVIPIIQELCKKKK